jgi:hypothetical protein
MAETQDRLTQIRARLSAATPGPWRTVAIPADESELATPGGEAVEHVDLFYESVPLQPVVGQHKPELGQNVFSADMSKRQQENVACLVHVNENDPDVQFIAHAPEDVGYLLHLLTHAQQEREKLRRALETIYGDPEIRLSGMREVAHRALEETDGALGGVSRALPEPTDRSTQAERASLRMLRRLRRYP